jgi:outer membrane lipoprotein-sorting protein
MAKFDARTALGLLFLAAALPAGATGPENLASYVQPTLTDVRATIVVEKTNTAALNEISKNEEKGYRIKRTQFSLKEPNKARVEGKYGLISILYVINGDRKLRSALGVRKVKNIAQKPGERFTTLEIGALSATVEERLESRLLRWETRNGKKMPVFEVRFKGEPGGARPEQIVIDPTTRVIVERSVMFRTRPKVKARYLYLNPIKYAGDVWLPTRVELYSPSGKLAAVSRYDGVTVNAGLPDTLFQF